MAKKYNKTIGQIILRWLVQQDITVIPRSTSKKHLAENLDIFDFSIDTDDILKIQQINLNQIN